jgi:glycolate oxidase iron-sulfur subunit
MQTSFTPAALADPDTAVAAAVIRKCVHCGFCTATCPTYVLLGDELDSPRGRIYLMKDMLEGDRDPTAEVVKHIDRCLSCLSCMTTCPSGVNYMHLVDHARAYIAERYKRPWRERMLRGVLSWVLPHPGRFRIALALARLARPMEPLFAKSAALKPMAAMLKLAPKQGAPAPKTPTLEPAVARKGRVVLLQGCAEPVLRPEIRESAVRLLTRAGYAVAFAQGEVCCGSLVHHMGQKEAGLQAARLNVDAWMAEIEGQGVDAILVTTSGCGTTIKDYGFMLREDAAYAERAARVSGLARDISEFMDKAELPANSGAALPMRVAYHAACSLQHGQKVTEAPKRLLSQAGFQVVVPREAHLCCGSAGVYNILQPELATRLRDRKAANVNATGAAVVAAGNVGCMAQLAPVLDAPIVHPVELLDWATGGPKPQALQQPR